MATKPVVKPEFATSDLNNGPLGAANVQEPSSGVKASGWLYGQKPPREFFNWLHRITYLWIDWFDQEVDALKAKVLGLENKTTNARQYFKNQI